MSAVRHVQFIQSPLLAFPEGHKLSKLDPVLQSILLNRGVTEPEHCENDLSYLLPFEQLKGIDQACDLLFEALLDQRRTLIVGDFDADGATSTALAIRALKAFGFTRLDYLVPDRFKFGYGLSPAIVDLAAKKGAELIITVDNGISSIEGVDKANALNIDVLVTDHHLAGERLPAAKVIINPNQPGCHFPSKALAGVGVMFYLLIGFRAKLRKHNYFQQQAEPNLAQWLDLVALGTVADLVPLDINNRRLVQQGLSRIRAGQACEGVRALIEVAKKNESTFKSTDFGFALGPRLNAAGRLDSMSIGIECLLCDERRDALTLAYSLNDLNDDRKQIEGAMKEEALNLLPEVMKKENEEVLICLFDERWHQGVVGIVASRLKEIYHLPSVIFAQDDENPEMLKGSARSVQGLHMRDALDLVAKRHPEVLKKFGGHAMAAGMSIRKADFSTFETALRESIVYMLGENQKQILQAQVYLDAPLQAGHFNLDFARQLQSFEPWGQQFPEPVFRSTFRIEEQRVLSEKHLKMLVSFEGLNHKLDAIAFNVAPELWAYEGKQLQFIYRLDINEFRGLQSLQLIVEKMIPLDSF